MPLIDALSERSSKISVHMYSTRFCITLFLCIVFLYAICGAGKVSYNGYKLIQVQITDMLDVEWLQRISDDDDRKADIWSYPTRNHPYMDILVSPDFLPTLSKLLKSSKLYYRITIEDVGDTIARTESTARPRTRRFVKSRPSVVPFPLDDYYPFEKIEAWLRYLNASHPHIFHLSSVGRTSQGRHLWLAKISTSPRHGTANVKKPAVFIDAGLHAREWISQATALYIIRELLRSNTSLPLLQNLDWYIVPVANPDGYVYSKTTDRLWRKSRSTRGRLSAYGACRGVDINRNFDYHWGEAGANTMNPCSNVYAGPHPFSEAETEALASKLRRLAPTLKAYVSLHSYGQLWLVPWGYHSEKPDNYPHQSQVAWKAMTALRRVNQTEYTFGTIADLMYPASGTSVDYAHSLGVPFTYALELRPEDSDQSHGFLYPAEYITPTGKETLEALKELAHEINSLYSPRT